MNKRMVKKREAMYQRVIKETVLSIVKENGLPRGQRIWRQFIRACDAPFGVMVVAMKRMAKGGLEIWLDREGVDMWPGCSYTFFRNSRFPVDFWEETRLFIEPSPFDRPGWIKMYRKIREIAPMFGGISFCYPRFDSEPLPLPA